MEKLSLTKHQEVRNISVDVADNGGIVLRFTIYTPSMKNSESSWDDRVEIYPEEEVDGAMDRIVDLYKADYANKKDKKSEKPNTPKASI